MQLTAENVHTILMECLYNNGEDTTGHVIGEGVMKKVGLHPDRLQARKADIESMLNELPESFHAATGGGHSFLNACLTKDGEQWGEHSNIDELIMLGNAIGKVEFNAPRELWSALPGGMPYFVVK